ncbi:3-hydroxyisobutyrate dehydrogenase [Stella humosa]|uniref:3-hydroxyisobutyrate dehydrogenase n=1 Tax=Stella humosa TaxID=94 RepID=A0A3N1L7K7_9PROT|nr:NAD(P)-dependent oxidoreductase [Stella humosa]ROP90603.1 3-hydroxyisobutyrate dehydrogenase [Stella humosa]BBK29501.1 oxidoreductase [Stella humosa]
MTGGRPRLGYIGLGLMGTEMTLRLLERGWQVTVWNLEPERVPPMVAAGAVAAASPAEVAGASDIVLMCVLHMAAVEACVFGPGGIAEGAAPGKILVDHSTAHPGRTAELARRLRDETGMGWVDAPVSGGTVAAREGSMTVMAGGAAADMATVAPVMADLAANFTHMGPCGAGQTAKLINQAIVGTNYVLMAEVLALAEASGIDAARLPQCLKGGHADGTLLQQLYPRMQARDFDPPRAYARQLLKDVHAVEEFVAGLGLDLPLVTAAVRRHDAHVTPENAMVDPASIIRLYDKKK